MNSTLCSAPSGQYTATQRTESGHDPFASLLPQNPPRCPITASRRATAAVGTHKHTHRRTRPIESEIFPPPATGDQRSNPMLGTRCSVLGARLESLSRQAESDGRTVGIVGQLNGRAVGQTGTMCETLPLSPVYWFGAAQWRVRWPSRGANGPGVTSERHQW